MKRYKARIMYHEGVGQDVYLCSDVDNAQPNVCKWTKEFTQHETRKTGCGKIYCGKPNIAYAPFCPYCGGLITHD